MSCGAGVGASESDNGVEEAAAEARADEAGRGRSGAGANGVRRMPADAAGGESKLKEGASGSTDCAPAPKAAKSTSMKRTAICRIENFPQTAFRAPSVHP